MNDLVSVLVVSYNSEDTILETLASVINQTYHNLQLVITDDGSNDGTRKVCETWLEKNFGVINFKTLWGIKNVGIAGNINKGLSHCNGRWIKIIAADDVLLPDCIRDNVNFIEANGYQPKIVFSKYLYYRGNEVLDFYYYARRFFTLNADKQYLQLLREIGVNAPTCFMDLGYLKSLGGCDTRFPLLDDAPLYLKFTEKGEKLYAFEKATVLYRIHSNNTSLGSADRFVNVGYWLSRKDFFEKVLAKALLERKMYLSWWSRYLTIRIQGVVISKGNRKSDYSFWLRLLRCCDIKYIFMFAGMSNKHINKEQITYVSRG